MNNNMHGNHYHRSQHNNNNMQYRGTSPTGNNMNMHSNQNFTLQFQDPTMDSKSSRVVFNSGNGDRGVHCGVSDNGNGMLDTVRNFQFQGYNQGKPFRQQMNTFRGDNYMQRNYIHPQGTQNQSRFVRIQGCKMRPQTAYRNFVQQKQKQSRGRFNGPMKHFNNYKSQRTFELNSDNFQIQKDVQDFIRQQRSFQQGTLEQSHEEASHYSPSPDAFNSNKSVVQDQPVSSSSSRSRGSNGSTPEPESGHSYNKKKVSSSSSKKLLRPKLEYANSPNSNGVSHNLSYEDVTENSNSNSDCEERTVDLRQRLLWKKHCEQVVKREPGEVCSDDEKSENADDELLKKAITVKKVKKSEDEKDGGKVSAKANILEDKKRSRKEKKQEKKIELENDESKKGSKMENPGTKHRGTSKSYSYHDDRCEKKEASTAEKEKGSGSGSAGEVRKHCCNTAARAPSSESDSKTFCCAEAEISDLKEKMESLKGILRDTRDKLLESRVVGSKKTLRLQQEIDQLKMQLSDTVKKDNDLMALLKSTQHELTTKSLELTKLTNLHDDEIREKEKFRADLNRTYQDRLTIEIDKLRALFDIEIAKMQSYYLSQNLYYVDGIGMTYVKGVSDCDLRGQGHTGLKGGNGLQRSGAQNMNLGGVSVTATSSSSASFLQPYYELQSQARCSGLSELGVFKYPPNFVGPSQHLCSPSSSNTRASPADSSSGAIDDGFGHAMHASETVPSSGSTLSQNGPC